MVPRVILKPFSGISLLTSLLLCVPFSVSFIYFIHLFIISILFYHTMCSEAMLSMKIHSQEKLNLTDFTKCY